MCYSAQIRAAYHRYVREYGAHIDLDAFVELYGFQLADSRIRTPKAMDDAFRGATAEGEARVWSLIEQVRRRDATRFEQELFQQRTRLVEAERALAVKTTKSATENRRIAADKIDRAKGRLADLQRVDPLARDARLFPGGWAPVLFWEQGRRVVRPMRYGCRPAGKPASYDVKYPGTYNARRDNLRGFWKGQFGRTHGVMVVQAFYENVARHRIEGRELAPDEAPENVVLEFRPQPPQDMLVACLWSRWTAPGAPDLWSFAAITDEPPPEVAAAGHDRCIIPIKPENLDAWLHPDATDLAAMEALLDDRERPYYEHRQAA